MQSLYLYEPNHVQQEAPKGWIKLKPNSREKRLQRRRQQNITMLKSIVGMFGLASVANFGAPSSEGGYKRIMQDVVQSQQTSQLQELQQQVQQLRQQLHQQQHTNQQHQHTQQQQQPTQVQHQPTQQQLQPTQQQQGPMCFIDLSGQGQPTPEPTTIPPWQAPPVGFPPLAPGMIATSKAPFQSPQPSMMHAPNQTGQPQGQQPATGHDFPNWYIDLSNVVDQMQAQQDQGQVLQQQSQHQQHQTHQQTDNQQ